MTRLFLRCLGLICLVWTTVAWAEEPSRRAYRLEPVDLKQPILWDEICRGRGVPALAFGGMAQHVDDPRPHTRLEIDGQFTPIHEELRRNNPLQTLHDQVREIRALVKTLAATARQAYFSDYAKQETIQANDAKLRKLIAGQLDEVAGELKAVAGDDYVRQQAALAAKRLQQVRNTLTEIDGINAASIRQLHQAQVELEITAEALDAEPPARAMDCGSRRKSDAPAQRSALVYVPSRRWYVLFGGDHLDYLTNDTWVFDVEARRWRQLHPPQAPPPRANHRLTLLHDDTLQLSGGFTYTSSTDYIGGQYIDLRDGTWTFDLKTERWKHADGSGAGLVASDTRTYRTGPFHPDYFLKGERPDAESFQAWLKKLEPNTWTATNPPLRPELNRDWGTARRDPDRDLMLRWSGGHSAHGGTDVPHYHFATNRWELPSAVEFPLGHLYSNTGYPLGYSFNVRPWMTGHTYQSYAYDLPSKQMVSVGQQNHFYLYRPELGDWARRGAKPKAMVYNNCYYTLTLTATPHGVICWNRYGRVHRFSAEQNEWVELELSGDKLPGAYVDNSSIVYDSNRDRVLMINTEGYGKKYSGEVWVVDLKSGKVTAQSPAGREYATRLATIDKSCFDPQNDLLLVSTHLQDGSAHTPTPAYDCRANRWVTLDLAYETGTRGSRPTRAFPGGRSAGIMYDTQRNLIWGTDADSQVYVLKLDLQSAGARPLGPGN